MMPKFKINVYCWSFMKSKIVMYITTVKHMDFEIWSQDMQ